MPGREKTVISEQERGKKFTIQTLCSVQMVLAALQLPIMVPKVLEVSQVRFCKLPQAECNVALCCCCR